MLRHRVLETAEDETKHCALCSMKDGIKEKGGARPGRGGREFAKEVEKGRKDGVGGR